MRNIKSVVLIVFGILVLSLSAMAVDISGEWEMKMTMRDQERVSVIKFVQDGENLTVTMEGRRGGNTEGKGTVKGNDVEWTVVRETPRGTMEMAYKATVDGDSMKGVFIMGERGEVEFTATKK
ncbi:hypothetical protein ACFLT9_08015 [Acidobacteriota bacterium]